MTKNALRAGTTAKAARNGRSSAVRVYATSRVDRCSKSEIMVAPSILSANFAKLGEQVRAVCRIFRRGTCVSYCDMSRATCRPRFFLSAVVVHFIPRRDYLALK